MKPFGKENTQNIQGVVADFCPNCDHPTKMYFTERGTTSRFLFMAVDQVKKGDFLLCTECSKVYFADHSNYTKLLPVSQALSSPLKNVLAVTNPEEWKVQYPGELLPENPETLIPAFTDSAKVSTPLSINQIKSVPGKPSGTSEIRDFNSRPYDLSTQKMSFMIYQNYLLGNMFFAERHMVHGVMMIIGAIILYSNLWLGLVVTMGLIFAMEKFEKQLDEKHIIEFQQQFQEGVIGTLLSIEEFYSIISENPEYFTQLNKNKDKLAEIWPN